MNQTWLRLMGISGILGGLILFSGDMLFYYDNNSTNLLENMAKASDFRIMASGFSALLATWFYLIGLGQVYMVFKSVKRIIRNIVLVCFAGILTSYGIVHAAYVAIATSAKIAVENNLDIEATTLLASNTNDLLRVLGYPLFGILSILFISQVWKQKTLYPRWMVFFFPLLPFLFSGVLNKLLSGKLWVIINGGFLNLILVIFFTASTIALWNVKTRKDVFLKT
jgi:hypothetical protein